MPEQRKVYFNGEYVSESEARVSIFDAALMFGDMVFEMTRTYNGKPFRLREHLERLFASMKMIEIDCGMSLDEMTARTMETMELNAPVIPKNLDIQIMHNVSRGPLSLYRSVFPEGLRPTVTINCWPMIEHLSWLDGIYESGVHAVLTPQRSVPARLIDPKIKNRSRIYYQIANLQAAKIDPKAHALLLDEDGYITEGTGDNFFLVKDGQIRTPEPRNILRGVTRMAVMELVEEIGIPCTECNLEPYDVMTADEAFFTATSFAILPITRFNGQDISEGTPGPLTNKLISAWSDKVGVDIVSQAKECAVMAQENR